LLTLWRNRPDWMLEQQELQYLDRRSDGFIFIAPVGHYQLVETLVRHELPVVACYTTDVPPEVPTVVLDNADALRQTVTHLVEQGHERILHLSPGSARSDFRARREGYETTMESFGLQPRVFEVQGALDVGRPEAYLAAIREQGITAVACATDGLALQSWDVFDAHGVSVPGDISLTGMDDVAESAARGLTSVTFSCHEVGRLAAVSLIELIQGGNNVVAQSVVPVHLTRRTSVAAPAASKLPAAPELANSPS
jgi:DNA-binding LacI/PurR family transcriptional regulator